VEHSRHRSPVNFLVNLLAALSAYSFLPHKPSIRRPYDTGDLLLPAWNFVELTLKENGSRHFTGCSPLSKRMWVWNPPGPSGKPPPAAGTSPQTKIPRSSYQKLREIFLKLTGFLEVAHCPGKTREMPHFKSNRRAGCLI
jgi:hypothetical protein